MPSTPAACHPRAAIRRLPKLPRDLKAHVVERRAIAFARLRDRFLRVVKQVDVLAKPHGLRCGVQGHPAGDVTANAAIASDGTEHLRLKVR